MGIEIGLQTQRYLFSQVRAPPIVVNSQGTRRSAPPGMPGSAMQAYELFKFYSASWASLVDDFCLVVFLIGMWVLFAPVLSPLIRSVS